MYDDRDEEKGRAARKGALEMAGLEGERGAGRGWLGAVCAWGVYGGGRAGCQWLSDRVCRRELVLVVGAGRRLYLVAVLLGRRSVCGCWLWRR